MEDVEDVCAVSRLGIHTDLFHVRRASGVCGRAAMVQVRASEVDDGTGCKKEEEGEDSELRNDNVHIFEGYGVAPRRELGM